MAVSRKLGVLFTDALRIERHTIWGRYSPDFWKLLYDITACWGALMRSVGPSFQVLLGSKYIGCDCCVRRGPTAFRLLRWNVCQMPKAPAEFGVGGCSVLIIEDCCKVG